MNATLLIACQQEIQLIGGKKEVNCGGIYNRVINCNSSNIVAEEEIISTNLSQGESGKARDGSDDIYRKYNIWE